MAMTYSQLQDVKARIVRDLAAQQAQLDSAIASFTVIKNALAGMQTTYSVWATEVNDALSAAPSDNALKALKAERDLLVDEFAAKKVTATALETAVNGV